MTFRIQKRTLLSIYRRSSFIRMLSKMDQLINLHREFLDSLIDCLSYVGVEKLVLPLLHRLVERYVVVFIFRSTLKYIYLTPAWMKRFQVIY